MDQEQPNEAPKQPVPEEKPPTNPTPPTSGPFAALEAWLYTYLVVKAPFQLPVGLKEFIVKYGPWITLVLGILLLPAIFAIFTLGSLVGTVASMYTSVTVGPMYWIAMLLLVVQIVIMFVSVPMLLKRKRSGWLLVFYADLLSLGYSIFSSFSYGYFTIGSLIGGLIGATIGFYFLFQIRSYYTK